MSGAALKEKIWLISEENTQKDGSSVDPRCQRSETVLQLQAKLRQVITQRFKLPETPTPEGLLLSDCSSSNADTTLSLNTSLLSSSAELGTSNTESDRPREADVSINQEHNYDGWGVGGGGGQMKAE
ncbi:hypothetical protein NQZ68_002453 [Dissostichus eleginoides]|nr:hypothetical protein NQZ68_002453 [Dissostichus eleginoides]